MPDKPNVFISWSGDRSKAAALALRKHLRSFINAAVPWMSDKDIRSGTVGLNEILGALQSAKAGIICLTADNIESAWPSFEAGVLYKALPEEGRVCTYLLPGIEHQNLTGPLKSFQFNRADESGTHKLLSDINAHLGGTVPQENLDSVFDKMWPELERELQNLPKSTAPDPPPRKTELVLADILEVLSTLADSIKGVAAETEIARRERLNAEHLRSVFGPISGYTLTPNVAAGLVTGGTVGPLSGSLQRGTIVSTLAGTALAPSESSPRSVSLDPKDFVDDDTSDTPSPGESAATSGPKRPLHRAGKKARKRKEHRD